MAASFWNPRFSLALSPPTFGSGGLGFFLLLGFSCDPSGVSCSLGKIKTGDDDVKLNCGADFSCTCTKHQSALVNYTIFVSILLIINYILPPLCSTAYLG